MEQQLRIGIAGLGTVGGGVWKHLHANAELLLQRTRARIVITRVAVRRAERAQALGVAPELVTPNWQDLPEDPNIDVVVELIGGTTDAYELIRRSLEAGKHVVTANKALLAECGEELFALAAKKRRQLLFEASVAGGIPIIKALREGLVANRIISLHGIVNGTCNYILSQMSSTGRAFADVLADAKALGYAEADERLDVEGHDAAHKAAILAALAYGFWVPMHQVYTEGITKIEQEDVMYAHQLGYELKLLAIIQADQAGAVEVRVHPTLVPKEHVLASVSGVFNAVYVRGDVVGDALFYGRGAGADPTASAVIGDIAEIASLGHAGCYRGVGFDALYARVRGIEDIQSRYYLRLEVVDRPGVLATVASVLGNHGIGILSVIQPERDSGKTSVPLVIMLHDAIERNVNAAIAEISHLDVVKEEVVRIRVEPFSKKA
ncbi:MAG: homoserine dehydrogenase [Candidatus Methylacidiphilales bacterium]|nr:homoserine dehydrogenase [Candidatus Methylacidiphilales bacterium]